MSRESIEGKDKWTDLQIERVQLRSEENGKQHENRKVMCEICRPFPLERCPVCRRELRDNPFRLGSKALGLTETSPCVLLVPVRVTAYREGEGGGWE